MLRVTRMTSSGHIQKNRIGQDGKPSSKPTLKSVVSGLFTNVPVLTPSQVTKLCGPEPLTKYIVFCVVVLQLCCAAWLRTTPILSAPFLLTAYIVGATANQNVFLAIHEISHNLAFRSPLANRLFAVFANLPIGVPYSAAFRVRGPLTP